MGAMAVEVASEQQAFLDWLGAWEAGLEDRSLQALIAEAGGPEGVACFSVDVLRGFCEVGCGPLASARVGHIVRPVAELFQRAYELGVRRFILTQDAHPSDSPEFQAWPPHCLADTAEAETMPGLRNLPFSDQFFIIPKRSINSALGTDLEQRLRDDRFPQCAIAVGDCTDLCVYQLAMHLRLYANAHGLAAVRVVVPANCVQTYDLPVAEAERLGALPHDGDLMHRLFLYHLRLNGVEIVRALT